jgi:hypothetical protein
MHKCFDNINKICCIIKHSVSVDTKFFCECVKVFYNQQNNNDAFYRPKEVPVFHSTWEKTSQLSYKYFFDVANKYKSECPMSMSLWYPNCQTTTSPFVYLINSILFQWIPAYFVDFLMLIFAQKRL